MNSLGAPGDRSQQDLGRRHREVRPMVFADAEKIDAQIVGENRLVDDVADDLSMRQQMAIIASRDVAKGIQPKFQTSRHVAHDRFLATCGRGPLWSFSYRGLRYAKESFLEIGPIRT